jgi:hypothetical protein
MNIQTAPTSSVATSSGFADFTLKQLRVAFVHSRILTNAIEVAGVALRADLISAEQAIADVIAAGGCGLITWESSQ